MINFNNAAKGQSRIKAQVLGNLFDGTEIFFVVLHALAHPHDLTLSSAKGVFSSVAYRRCHHQQYLKCVIWLMGDSQENIGQIKNVRPLRHSSTFFVDSLCNCGIFLVARFVFVKCGFEGLSFEIKI